MNYFYPKLEENTLEYRKFQWWMKIGTPFPSIFGSGTYVYEKLA